MNGEVVREGLRSERPSGPDATTPPREPPARSRRAVSARTVVYFSGLSIILAALAWAALLIGIPEPWIGVGLLFGLGIILIKGTRYSPHPPR